jgi:hypothetical protein
MNINEQDAEILDATSTTACASNFPLVTYKKKKEGCEYLQFATDKHYAVSELRYFEIQ